MKIAPTSPEPLGKFIQTCHKASLGEGDSILFKEELFNSHKDNNVYFLVLINVMI